MEQDIDGDGDRERGGDGDSGKENQVINGGVINIWQRITQLLFHCVQYGTKLKLQFSVQHQVRIIHLIRPLGYHKHHN